MLRFQLSIRCHNGCIIAEGKNRDRPCFLAVIRKQGLSLFLLLQSRTHQQPYGGGKEDQSRQGLPDDAPGETAVPPTSLRLRERLVLQLVLERQEELISGRDRPIG